MRARCGQWGIGGGGSSGSTAALRGEPGSLGCPRERLGVRKLLSRQMLERLRGLRARAGREG